MNDMKQGEQMWRNLGVEMGYSFPVIAPPAITIPDASALYAALAEAKAGDVLHLGADMGFLTIPARDYGGVTIKGGSAKMIVAKGLSDLTFSGIRLERPSLKGEDGNTFLMEYSSNCVIEDCIIKGGQYGLAVVGGEDNIVRRNFIHDQFHDSFRVSRKARNMLIEDNLILNNLPAEGHADLLQMFGGKNGTGIPRGITIRRNVLYSTAVGGGRQGIFITDPNGGEVPNSYSDILVEQNFVQTNNSNTLVLGFAGLDGSCRVENNTLKGSGNLKVHANVYTARNVAMQAGNGLPNRDRDFLYGKAAAAAGTVFKGWAVDVENMVADKAEPDQGCYELIAHLRAGLPHGMDLV